MFKYLSIITLAMGISLIGTMIGASIGVIVRNPSRKLLGSIMGFAGGLMLAVVVFELIPEAINKTNILFTVIFYTIGIAIVMFIERVTDRTKVKTSNYMKMAMITSLGLMLHNFPEGIIMGCGFLVEQKLGIQMSIIIALHDIPEGIAVTAPLMASKVKSTKIMIYAFLTALPTALGAALGVMAGNISDFYLGLSLALASGIMMYVVFGELVPESNKLLSGILNTLSVIMGLTLGFIMINLI